MDLSQDEITNLLQQVVNGKRAPRERLFEVIYEQLVKMATAAMKGERKSHTLQPSALVNSWNRLEIFLRDANAAETLGVRVGDAVSLGADESKP